MFNILSSKKNRDIFIVIMSITIIAISAGVIILKNNNKVVETESKINSSHIELSHDSNKSNFDDISIKPVKSDAAGVDVESAFTISSYKNYDVDVLKSVIKVEPEEKYNITKTNDKEFTLRFNKNMEPNSIYNIILKSEKDDFNYSWAFQTKKEFKILRSLPRDKATSVPVNSGVEISFSHEGIGAVDDFFEIEPKVSGRFEYHKKAVVFVPDKLEYDTIYSVIIKSGISLNESTEKIKEGFTFQFQTEKLKNNSNLGYEAYLNFSNNINNFTSDIIPAIEVYSGKYFDNKELGINIYRYEDDDNFFKDIKRYEEFPYWANINTDKIKFEIEESDKFLTFKTKIYNMESPYYKKIIAFPEKMPEGQYLLVIKSEKYEFKTHSN